MRTRVRLVTGKLSYRVDEVAERLSCHPKTVLRQIHKGKLPAYKIGSTWRIRAAQLQELEENK